MLKPFDARTRHELSALLSTRALPLLARIGVSPTTSAPPALGTAVVLLVADMACMGCARRSVTPKLLLTPPVQTHKRLLSGHRNIEERPRPPTVDADSSAWAPKPNERDAHKGVA